MLNEAADGSAQLICDDCQKPSRWEPNGWVWAVEDAKMEGWVCENVNRCYCPPCVQEQGKTLIHFILRDYS